MIYAHLSRNFVVVIYVLFPLIFKVNSANVFAFRMYDYLDSVLSLGY